MLYHIELVNETLKSFKNSIMLDSPQFMCMDSIIKRQNNNIKQNKEVKESSAGFLITFYCRFFNLGLMCSTVELLCSFLSS